MKLAGKAAIVTGAGSGIGKAIAQLFAAEGARVICVDRSGMEADVAAGIGGEAIAVQADVSRSEDVQRMIGTAERAFGRLDILCNNAGMTGPWLPLHEQEEASFDAVIGVNLKGVFLGMKYGIAAMLRSGGGSVVNTASVTGLVGWKDLSLYSASKGGIVQMTKAAALDYADHAIRVNAICPGATWTGMVSTEHVIPPADAPEAPGTPLGRWGMPAEVAAAVLFLASDDASFITGSILAVDGGYTAG